MPKQADIKNQIKAAKKIIKGKNPGLWTVALLALILGLALYSPNLNRNLKEDRVRGLSANIPSLAPAPENDGTPAPDLSAESAVIVDMRSNTIFFEKNPHTSLLPASTTKVMTAVVSLEHYALDDVITITNEDKAIGHEMGLKEGEKITVRNLLYGLLVESGNDAAFALANNYEGGYEAFIKEMNNKAGELMLKDTNFRNPSGLEEYNHKTSASDLATLAGYALENEIIRSIVETKSITVSDTSGSIVHDLKSTNELIGKIEGVHGLKTGWTENAGECLITFVERDGHPVVTVILNSDDRFGETTKIIDWVYGHHTWVVPSLDTGAL